MRLPPSLRNFVIFFVIWSVVLGIILHYYIQNDDLFSQIAIPIIGLTFQLLLSFQLMYLVWITYRKELFLPIQLVLSIVMMTPLVLAFKYIPVLQSMYEVYF